MMRETSAAVKTCGGKSLSRLVTPPALRYNAAQPQDLLAYAIGLAVWDHAGQSQHTTNKGKVYGR